MSIEPLKLHPSEGHHALTVNLLDYYHDEVHQYRVAAAQWRKLPQRLEDNAYRLLALFNQHEVKATFFILGWTAKYCPGLVRAIVSCGHECASLGYWNQPLARQSPTQIIQELRTTKSLIEDISGEPVYGYRAPFFDFGPKQTWLWQTLEQCGYQYSSSLCPTGKHGWPQAPRFAFQACPNGLYELPVTTAEYAGKRLFFANSRMMRLAPHWMTKIMGHQIALQQKPILYTIYPSDIDPEQPKQHHLNPLEYGKLYTGLNGSFEKVDQWLSAYEWTTIRHCYFQSGIQAAKAELASQLNESFL